MEPQRHRCTEAAAFTVPPFLKIPLRLGVFATFAFKFHDLDSPENPTADEPRVW